MYGPRARPGPRERADPRYPERDGRGTVIVHRRVWRSVPCCVTEGAGTCGSPRRHRPVPPSREGGRPGGVRSMAALAAGRHPSVIPACCDRLLAFARLGKGGDARARGLQANAAHDPARGPPAPGALGSPGRGSPTRRSLLVTWRRTASSNPPREGRRFLRPREALPNAVAARGGCPPPGRGRASRLPRSCGSIPPAPHRLPRPVHLGWTTTVTCTEVA